MKHVYNHYELLEISETASEEEIKAAYRSLAQQYHPDKVPPHLTRLKEEAEEKFKLLNEAYQVLTDIQKRSNYDSMLADERRKSSSSLATVQQGIVPHTQEHRKLAAIMFTDIKDYSKKMQRSEADAMKMLEVHNDMMRATIAKFEGTVIKTVGDAFLVSFESVSNAAECAVACQEMFLEYNKGKSENEIIVIRIGVHLGDIIEKDNDVFGDGVNIASRIQSLAEPGGINISESVYQQVKNKLDLAVLPLGAPQLKNIKEAVKVYQVIVGGGKGRSKFATQWLIFKTLMRRKQSKRNLAIGIPLFFIALFLVLPFDKYPHIQKFRSNALPWFYTLKEVEGRVAVLPFENNSRMEDYAVDGITDEVISSLGSIKGLFILDRNAVFKYKNSEEELPQIAEELGVRYVIKGLVRSVGDKIRISYELYDNQKSKKTIGKLDEDFSQENILAVQDRLAQSIAKELRITVTKEQQAAFAAKTQVNSKAYDFALRGLDYLRRNTKRDNEFAMQMFEKAITLDTTYALGFAELAYAQWLHYSWYGVGGKELLDLSLENAKHAQQLNPQLGEAYRVIGAVYSMAPPLAVNYTDDIDALNKAIELNSNDAISYYLLGSVYERKDLQQSLSFYEQAIQRSPTNSLFYLGKGRALAKMKLIDSALNIVQEAIEYQPDQIQGYLQLGELYFKKEKIAESENSYRRAIELQPENSSGYIGLAKLYLFLKKYSDGIDVYHSALMKDSLNRDIYFGLGECFLSINKEAESEKFFNRAIEIGQYGYRVINDVGRVYENIGNYEKALEYFNLSIEKNPDALSPQGVSSTDAYEGKTRTLTYLGRLAEAEVVSKKIIELSPNFAVSYANLALIQLILQRPQDAIVTIKKYQHYLDEPDLLMHLGTSYRMLNDIENSLKSYSEAEELYSKRLENAPRDPGLRIYVPLTYYYRGITLEKAGKKAEAFIQFEKSGQIYSEIFGENPKDFSALANIGLTKARIGEKNEANKIIQSLEKNGSEDPSIVYQICAIYSILNDIPNSIKYFKKAITFGFNEFDFLLIDPDMDNLLKSKEVQIIIKSKKKITS
ncbi:MAG: DnaJ domain-containing protein [Bacteroidota bacterium]